MSKRETLVINLASGCSMSAICPTNRLKKYGLDQLDENAIIRSSSNDITNIGSFINNIEIIGLSTNNIKVISSFANNIAIIGLSTNHIKTIGSFTNNIAIIGLSTNHIKTMAHSPITLPPCISHKN